MANSPPSPLALGRFRIEATVGSGATSRLFRVADPRSPEPRALKVVRTQTFERSLLEEFEQLARLEHPALPRVFEVGRTADAVGDVEPGAPYFVAEWIDGIQSDAWAWKGDAARLWAIAADIASALAAVHDVGLVHGDVAPQNVLVGPTRAVLVDLGLARASGARGTPAYMAPEAFTGAVEPRSDLYGLAATLVRIVIGRPPIEGSTLGELAQRILAGARCPALPGVPAPFADLIGRMLSRDVDARPASARAVLAELDQIAASVPSLGVHRDRGATERSRGADDVVGSRWAGADVAIEAIHDRLVSVADGALSVIAVTGPRAAGSRRLVDAAIRRWQLGRVAERLSHDVRTGSLDELARALGVEPSPTEAIWLERVARAARASSALIAIDVVDDPRARDTVAALARAPGSRAVVVIIDHVDPRPGVATIVAPALDAAGTAALAHAILGAPPPDPWIGGLLVASGGLPLTVIELVRSISAEAEPFAIDWRTRSSRGAVDLRAQQLVDLDEGAWCVALAIAAWGGRARIGRILGTARALQATGAVLAPGRVGRRREGVRAATGTEISGAAVLELERRGLASRDGEMLVVDRSTALAIEQTAGAPTIDAAITVAISLVASDRAAELPGDERPSRADLAPLLERARLDAVTAPLARDVARELLDAGRAGVAHRIARRALELEPAGAGLIAARAALAIADYAEAVRCAEVARQAGADVVETTLISARAWQRSGELDRAEEALSSLHALDPEQSEVAGAYARLLVTRSRYAEAQRVARRPPTPIAGLRAEAAGLAAFYVGALDDADLAFISLELDARAAGTHAAVGRALSLRGMVAQQRGRLGAATELYREAVARLEDAGERHAAATAALNLGTVLSERGRASEALPRLAEAARVFGELGTTTEQCAADLNRGNALLALGQAEEAKLAAEAAATGAGGAPHLRAFALLVLGDAHRRLGDLAVARSRYGEALAIARERGDTHAQVSAHVAFAELGEHGPGQEARGTAAGQPTSTTSDAEVEAACASDDDRQRWLLARARRDLDGDIEPARTRAYARACVDAGRAAADGDRLERAFRAYVLAAAWARRAGDQALASSCTEQARAAHRTWLDATAPAFRAVLARDPDLARVPTVAPAGAATTARGDRPDASPQLRRLLTLSRRLNTETSLERILDDVIDTAIELTAAERGFLLLRQADGELAVVVSRNFASADLAHDTPTVSRSIAERAAQTGEPVVTVDAGVDERFGMAASVAALRLRSVLAVPLRQRGAITGCIYVDHRLRGGAFDDDAASVLAELADIAAIAIENARLTSDLRRSSREVEDLNLRLAQELAERDAELARVKADLPDRDRLRHRYDAIIGRSEPMIRMLETIDRAASTALPVVIVGESGTGKELVARALHDHGPRKSGPFVAINCSAVPEPLLESELFGHARGAFTGADRDRRGLFEVADGGSLFLDEIADTSAAMQAKLLRVLQDGLLRRVGETTTRKVDVRVIAASQRPLASLGAEGRFREDLRFRIEVITINVPTLRERDGDLALLTEHLLRRLADGRVPRLTRAAMRALAQHRWPGNVRELENALARGVAMGGDVIDLADLPEAIAQALARPEPARPASPEDLRLKPALLATEQAYISAAMARAKGNQTVAARLLGLSRFGLQKKLRRLEGDDPEDEP